MRNYACNASRDEEVAGPSGGVAWNVSLAAVGVGSSACASSSTFPTSSLHHRRCSLQVLAASPAMLSASAAAALDGDTQVVGFGFGDGEGTAPYFCNDMWVEVAARKLQGKFVEDSWSLIHSGSAPDSPPKSPVAVEGVSGEQLRVRLVPYGCTRVRVSAFPWHV